MLVAQCVIRVKDLYYAKKAVETCLEKGSISGFWLEQSDIEAMNDCLATLDKLTPDNYDPNEEN